MDGDIKSIRFTSFAPEECWRQYHSARLTPGFDWEHYPEIDHFWHYEDVKFVPSTGGMEVRVPIHGLYTLVVIYGRDIAPNM